jgi:hypothetical protein
MSSVPWVCIFMVFMLGWRLLEAVIRERRAINANASTCLADYGIPVGFLVGAAFLLIAKLTPGPVQQWKAAGIVGIAGFLLVNALTYRKEAIWASESPRAIKAKERLRNVP